MHRFWIILFFYFVSTTCTLASDLRSDDDTTLKALAYIKTKEWGLAYATAKHSSSPKYTETLINFSEILAEKLPLIETLNFYKKNQWFPICAFQDDIEKRIPPNVSVNELSSWFATCTPKSDTARLLYLYSQIEIEKKNFDMEFLHLWVNTTNIPVSLDLHFFKTYKMHIPSQYISLKVENLVWENNFALASLYSKSLGAKEREKYLVRMQYAQHAAKPDKLVKKYPQYKNDAFIKFKQISRLLKKNQDADAYLEYSSVKTFSHPEPWWKPKHVIIRNLIKNGKYTLAYKISSTHGLKTGESFQDAEWISGWVALRFLNKPKLAIDHFYKVYTNARYTTSKSKAAYWLARCFKTLNNQPKTNKWFALASQHKGHFYGQLAKLEYTNNADLTFFDFVPPQNLTITSIDKNTLNIANAAYLYDRSGNKYLSRVLVKYLAESNIDLRVKYLLVDYLQKKGLISASIQFAKYVANRDGPLFECAYPLDVPLENYNNHKALYLALIRQESNFDQSAVSPAGAVGLMQLIPPTAKKYAKILGLPHNAFKVDASANVAKGAYYLDSLVLYFGSIVPALAAYNAGEGAVTRWVKVYGNPSTIKDRYDIIDWIESIPYSETRLYVKKVLENMLVYEKILEPNQSQQQFLVSYLGE